MNKFQERKNEFLDFWLENNETLKLNYMEAYINNIEKFELEKDKDLKDFDKKEIKEITGVRRRSKTGVKSVTETFIDEYLKWSKATEKAEKKEQRKLERLKLKQQKKDLEKETKEKMRKYIEQKKIFIEEYYFDKKENTKATYMDCYETHIAPLEAHKGKDLVNFVEEDIEEIFNSMSTTSFNVKRMVYNFIDNYNIWTDSKGMNITHTNPLQSLNKDELFELNLKAFRKQFLSMDETYELCEKAIENGSNYQDCIIILLARYGVEGKSLNDLLNVRWGDVDRERNKIRIIDEETGEIRELDIDERLIEWIDKAKECNYYNNGVKRNNSEKYFYDNGYIVKTQMEGNSGQEERRAIYRRINVFCKKVQIRSIQLKNLVSSREFDLINQVREIKGELVANDILYIHKIFYPNGSDSSYFFLMEKYELYYGIKVKSYGKDYRKRKLKLVDNEDDESLDK